MNITFKEITKENWEECIELKVSYESIGFRKTGEMLEEEVLLKIDL